MQSIRSGHGGPERVGDFLQLWNTLGDEAFSAVMDKFAMAQRDTKRASNFFAARYSQAMHAQRVCSDMKASTCISEELTARHVWNSFNSGCHKQANFQLMFAQGVKQEVMNPVQQLGEELKNSLDVVLSSSSEAKKKLEDQKRLKEQLASKIQKLSTAKCDCEIQLANHETIMHTTETSEDGGGSSAVNKPSSATSTTRKSLVPSLNIFRSKQARDETTLLKLRSKVNKLGDELCHAKVEFEHQQTVLFKEEKEYAKKMQRLMKELEFVELKRLQVMQNALVSFSKQEKKLYQNLFELAESHEHSASKLSSRDDIRAFRRQLHPSGASSWCKVSGNVAPISKQFLPSRSHHSGSTCNMTSSSGSSDPSNATIKQQQISERNPRKVQEKPTRDARRHQVRSKDQSPQRKRGVVVQVTPSSPDSSQNSKHIEMPETPPSGEFTSRSNDSVPITSSTVVVDKTETYSQVQSSTVYSLDHTQHSTKPKVERIEEVREETKINND